jgi:hypothetical protein
MRIVGQQLTVPVPRAPHIPALEGGLIAHYATVSLTDSVPKERVEARAGPYVVEEVGLPVCKDDDGIVSVK